jgi:hypothetical protein
MRDPTLPIGPLLLTSLGAAGFEAFAGCEASTKQTATAAVKAHRLTRIYAPLPAVPAKGLARYRWALKRRVPRD